MKWIDIKDKQPQGRCIIVAIMNGRPEQIGDPVENCDIAMVRCDDGRFCAMDSAQNYYIPNENVDIEHWKYFDTINYWMPYEDFNFPEPLLLKES